MFRSAKPLSHVSGLRNTGATIVHLAARSGSVTCLDLCISLLQGDNAPRGTAPSAAARDTGASQTTAAAPVGGGWRDVARAVDTSMGWPPLFYAADAGKVETVTALLTRYAVPVYACDRRGTSALHLAALGGFEAIIDTLIAHGHPVDCASLWLRCAMCVWFVPGLCG